MEIFEPSNGLNAPHMTSQARIIAFHLPQFHPTPENDEWWGKGFTEWTNTAKALPLFPDHYQPHVPADLGFYDLRLPEARRAQADLAREHGIEGFYYYHYWFNGRRILERPFNEVLASGKPDFPFCLCWANENWTRVWDGGEKNVLLQQNYSDADDLAHNQSLMLSFRDPRYIRIDGRPLFLVYRTELMPDPARTAAIWRDAAIKAGIGDLYLARVEGFQRGVDPAEIGFDAAVEFAPSWDVGTPKFTKGVAGSLSRAGVLPKSFADNDVINYSAVAQAMAARPPARYKQFRCATPMWDNSARRKQGARILVDSTPAQYEAWLKSLARQTLADKSGDDRIVFINAWNEWAEGNHLEPDLKWGHAYLEATSRALAETEAARPQSPAAPQQHAATAGPSPWRQRYWSARSWLSRQREILSLMFSRRS